MVIPAYNEADRIAETVRAATSVPGVSEVIVVDDGSVDNTAEQAAAAGATVLRLAVNRGKGAALARGLALARGEVIVLLDADVGETASEIARLLGPVLAGEADMAIARFPAPPTRRGLGLVRGVARWGLRLLTGQDFASPLSGQRAVRRAWLDGLPLAEGFGVEVGLTVDLWRRGCRIVEVPVAMRHRETGMDLAGLRHRGRELLHILRALSQRAGAVRRPALPACGLEDEGP